MHEAVSTKTTRPEGGEGFDHMIKSETPTAYDSGRQRMMRHSKICVGGHADRFAAWAQKFFQASGPRLSIAYSCTTP